MLARNYGSELPRLVDAPINATTKVEVFAETVDALRRHEPRIRVRRVRLVDAIPGRAVVSIDAVDRDGRQLNFEGLVIGGQAAGVLAA